MKYTRHLLWAIIIGMLLLLGHVTVQGQTATLTKNTMKLARPWIDTNNPVGDPASGFSKTDVLNVTSTQTSWMFDFTNKKWYQVNAGYWTPGPQGPQGLTGQIGPTGPMGPKGPDGKCPDCPTTGTGTQASYLSTRWVNSWSELKQAFLDMNTNGYPTDINLGQDITGVDNDSIQLTLRPIMWALRGHGRAIIKNGTVLYRDATSVQQSEVMIDMMPTIEDVKFLDKSGKGNAIRISSTYTGEIRMCQFFGYRDAILLPRGMNYQIHGNEFWNGTGWYINLTYKGVPGGGSSTTQPNVALIHNNKFRVDSLAAGAVLTEGGSLIVKILNIIEGGTDNHNGSDYGFKDDYAGSPNVKSTWTLLNHFEVKFAKAAYSGRLNDGFVHYVGNYRQYGGTELDIDCDGGYPQINYTYQDYVVNNSSAGFTQWKSNGGVWNFTGLQYPISESNSSMWVGGAVPYYRSSTGYGEGADKYLFLRANPSFKITGTTVINGKQY